MSPNGPGFEHPEKEGGELPPVRLIHPVAGSILPMPVLPQAFFGGIWPGCFL